MIGWGILLLLAGVFVEFTAVNPNPYARTNHDMTMMVIARPAIVLGIFLLVAGGMINFVEMIT